MSVTFSTPFIQIWLWRLCDSLTDYKSSSSDDDIFLLPVQNKHQQHSQAWAVRHVELGMSAGWMERKCSSSVVTTSNHSDICSGFTSHRWMMISTFMPRVCYYRWHIHPRFRLYFGLTVRSRLYYMNQLLLFQEADGPVVSLMNNQSFNVQVFSDSIITTNIQW